MAIKQYSQLSMLVDLVSHHYQTSNPILISEHIKEDFGLDYTIHQISDYLEVNRFEDYERQSREIEYIM